jgi:hypothetical protein
MMIVCVEVDSTRYKNDSAPFGLHPGTDSQVYGSIGVMCTGFLKSDGIQSATLSLLLARSCSLLIPKSR